jgi:hypothetical protein
VERSPSAGARGDGSASTILIALAVLGVGVVGIFLLARRDENAIVAQWQKLLSREEGALRQSLEARIRLHRSAIRWWRSRASDAAAEGSIMTAAELRQAERKYEQETAPERRALLRARRMLNSRRR